MRTNVTLTALLHLYIKSLLLIPISYDFLSLLSKYFLLKKQNRRLFETDPATAKKIQNLLEFSAQ